MKILLTVASLKPSYGGPAFSVSQLAAALDGAGVEVGLWAPDGSAEETRLLPEGSAVRRLSGSLSSAVATCGAPDVLHDNGIWLPHNHGLARWAAATGAPRVVSTRGMLEPWARRHKRLKKALAWTAYQRRDLHRAQSLHATAQPEADNLAPLRLGPPTTVIANGVPMPPLAARPPPGGVRTALFLGRLYPVKGLPMLVEAWARARPDGWRLHIAGPDEAGHRAEIEAAVAAAGLKSLVTFVGPVEGAAKSAAFAAADLFILPSHSESFGMAVGEALAHGVPVLTTRAAPWPALETDACGWWVETSPAGLADGLRAAAATAGTELQAMGARGRALIAREFSWDAAAREMIALYECVAKARR